MSSLKHFKSEVDTVKTDRECGISLVDQDVDFQVGDIVICFDTQEVKQEIDWTPGF